LEIREEDSNETEEKDKEVTWLIFYQVIGANRTTRDPEAVRHTAPGGI
jgi:hypothetical protein